MNVAEKEAAALWVKLQKIPRIAGAKIFEIKKSSQYQISSTWSIKDPKKLDESSFVRTHIFDSATKSVSELNIGATRASSVLKVSELRENGEFFQIVEVGEKKEMFIEKWSQQKRLQRIDLSKTATSLPKDLEITGAISVSSCGRHVVFSAETKGPDEKTFFDDDSKSEKTEEKPVFGQKYLSKKSWGEQMTKTISPNLVLVDFETEKVEKLVFEEASLGQPQINSRGEIIFMALDEKPFKLGRIYCTNRPIAIYKTSISDFSKFEKLTDNEYSARSPRWIPGNDESFIFLKRTTYGPHLECDALCKFTDCKIQEIVPVVKDYPKTATEFAGIYCTELKSSPFLILPSGEPLLLQSTITKSSVIVFAISMSGEIQRITEPGKSSYVSSICGNSAAIISCSENTSESVHILQMKSATDFSLEEVVSASDSFERVHENFELVSKSKRTFETHFTGKSGNKNLALYPHGGPNSNVTKSFSTTFIGLGELGYDILMPNYTGSVGYGQDNVYSLGGNIGDYDIADCLDALDHHLKTSKNSYENVFVFGGSHGGFLTAHLTAARPDQFRAAVIRNPVIDLNSMHHVTDIPDWNEWQGLNIPPLSGKPPSEEQILELRKRSPIAYAHKVKTPTLMNIGLKDLRVPPPQGDQWIKALRSYGVSCEQYDYPEDCHPLGSTETLGDIFVHLHRWFNMHKQ